MNAKKYTLEFSHPFGEARMAELIKRLSDDSEVLDFKESIEDIEIKGEPLKGIYAISTDSPESFLKKPINFREQNSYIIDSFLREVNSESDNVSNEDAFSTILNSGKSLANYFNFRNYTGTVTIINTRVQNEYDRYIDIMSKPFLSTNVYTLERVGDLLIPVRPKNKYNFMKKNFDSIFTKIVTSCSGNITHEYFYESGTKYLELVAKAIKKSYKDGVKYNDSLGLLLELYNIDSRVWKYSDESKKVFDDIIKYARKCALKFNTKGEVFNRYTKRKDESGNKGQYVDSNRSFRSGICDSIMRIFRDFNIIEEDEIKAYRFDFEDGMSDDFKMVMSRLAEMNVVLPKTISYRQSVKFIKNDSIKFPLAYNFIGFMSEMNIWRTFQRLNEFERKVMRDYMVRLGSRFLLVKELPEILLWHEIAPDMKDIVLESIYGAIENYESREALTVMSLINNDLTLSYKEEDHSSSVGYTQNIKNVKVFSDIPERYKRVRKIYFEAILKK